MNIQEIETLLILNYQCGTGTKNMNFDTIVMNPPYLSKQMVYLKFLKKAQDCGHHVLGLHPAIPFLDQRKKNRWTNLLNTFSKNLNYLRVIHSKKYFPDVDIQSILCITYFSANIKPLDYCCDLTGINLVIPKGNPDLYSGHLGYDKLFDRFNSLKKEDTILDWEIPRKHYKTEGWVVELSLVRGMFIRIIILSFLNQTYSHITQETQNLKKL